MSHGFIHVATIQEVTAECGRAAAKHGDGYMGNIAHKPSNTLTLVQTGIAGSLARVACDGGYAGPLDVLVEEIGELAEDIANGRDIRAELTQVAAMALAWLEAIS